MVQMARISKKTLKKPLQEKHGNILKVELSYENKYLNIIAKDGFVITISDNDFLELYKVFEISILKEQEKQRRKDWAKMKGKSYVKET